MVVSGNIQLKNKRGTQTCYSENSDIYLVHRGTVTVASTTGTEQIQRRNFLPFKAAGAICPGISHGAWLFWTLLVGMSVMVSNRNMPENLSLERTDASQKSVASVPLLPAKS